MAMEITVFHRQINELLFEWAIFNSYGYVYQRGPGDLSEFCEEKMRSASDEQKSECHPWHLSQCFARDDLYPTSPTNSASGVS